MLAKGFLNKRADGLRQLPFKGGLLPPTGHLRPDPAQDVNQLPLVMLLCKALKMAFQKYQTDHILEQLRFGVALKMLFADKGLHPCGGLLVVSDLA